MDNVTNYQKLAKFQDVVYELDTSDGDSTYTVRNYSRNNKGNPPNRYVACLTKDDLYEPRPAKATITRIT